MKKMIRLVLGIIVTGIFLILIFHNLDFDQVKKAFAEAEISWIFLAFIAFLVGYACRTERWRIMLTQENPELRWQNCIGPLIASFAINNLLPFRMGDFFRAFLFNRRVGVAIATSLTTLIVERLLDLLMVIVFLSLALAYFGMESSKLVGFGGGFLVIMGMSILLLLMLPSLFKPLVFFCCRFLSTYLPKFSEKILSEFHKVFMALEYIANGYTMLKLIFWSIFAWISEGFVFWFIAISIPSISNNFAAWFALSIGTFATIIPSTPGYVGTFDYFTSQAMVALGNDPVGSTVFSLIVHIVLWLPPIILGGIYLLFNPIQKQEKLKGILQ